MSEDRGSYLGECYWPGVNEQKLDHAAERVRTAADELPGRRHDLRFGGSILVPAGQTIVWLFDGDEADMRALSEQASVASERVLRSRPPHLTSVGVYVTYCHEEVQTPSADAMLSSQGQLATPLCCALCCARPGPGQATR